MSTWTQGLLSFAEGIVSIFTRKAGSSSGDRCEEEDFVTPILISTWYLACRDQARLDPIGYIKNSLITVARTQRKVDIPQEVYSLCVALTDQFREGRVNMNDLNNLKPLANETLRKASAIKEEIHDGEGDYTYEQTGCGMPKVVTDAFYPFYLLEFIADHITDDGLVSNMPDSTMEMINLFISDEMSALERIGPSGSQASHHPSSG